MTFMEKCCDKLQINIQEMKTQEGINKIRQVLKENYIKFWEMQIGLNLTTEGKLYTYRKFKTKFIYENYLDYVYLKDHRVAVTQLRVSAHRLEIEKGHHQRPVIPRNERFCKFCLLSNNKIIGDETHFLMGCPQLKNEREILWVEVAQGCKHFNDMNEEMKLLYLLTCENELITFVAKFVSIGFEMYTV